MATLVMKFGGSLMSDARRISRVAQVITGEALAWDRLVVVVSAMAGVTDALNRAVDQALIRDASGFRRTIAGLRSNHLTTITTLIENDASQRELTTQIDNMLFGVLAICDSVMARRDALPRERDAAMAAGERMMAAILAAVVRQEGLDAASVDAADVIVTDDRHMSANPLLDRIDERVEKVIRPLLDAGIVPLVTGFIGRARTGVITTLGRGGSDYTATILAASLHADEVWMWTSVDGVMSADPALVPTARVIPVLSYGEVGELSYFGAHVVHPRAVEPLLVEKIPLRVRNPFNLDHAGTLIQADSDENGIGLKAVTAVDGLALSTRGRSIDVVEVLNQVHGLVGRTATGPVSVMQSYAHSQLVFVVPTSEGPTAVTNAAQKLIGGLGTERWEVKVVKVIAVMGTTTPTAITDLTALGIHPVVSMRVQDGRRVLAVSPGDVQAVVRQLHKLTNQPNQAVHSSGRGVDLSQR
jgi:aspartate kinase